MSVEYLHLSLLSEFMAVPFLYQKNFPTFYYGKGGESSPGYLGSDYLLFHYQCYINVALK